MIKQRDLLIIILMTFITVTAWIGFNIYHIAVTSTIGEELQTQISPINPVFDVNTINKLKKRDQVDPAYQFNNSDTDISATGSADITVRPTISILQISPTASKSR